MKRNRIKYGHCEERFCDEAICMHKDCFTIVRNDISTSPPDKGDSLSPSPPDKGDRGGFLR